MDSYVYAAVFLVLLVGVYKFLKHLKFIMMVLFAGVIAFGATGWLLKGLAPGDVPDFLERCNRALDRWNKRERELSIKLAVDHSRETEAYKQGQKQRELNSAAHEELLNVMAQEKQKQHEKMVEKLNAFERETR